MEEPNLSKYGMQLHNCSVTFDLVLANLVLADRTLRACFLYILLYVIQFWFWWALTGVGGRFR